jgi:hypothetical protein
MSQPPADIEIRSESFLFDYNEMMQKFAALVLSRIYCALPEYQIVPDGNTLEGGFRLCVRTADGKRLLTFAGQNETACARDLLDRLEQAGLWQSVTQPSPGTDHH